MSELSERGRGRVTVALLHAMDPMVRDHYESGAEVTFRVCSACASPDWRSSNHAGPRGILLVTMHPSECALCQKMARTYGEALVRYLHVLTQARSLFEDT